jgi:hypothetical protein
MNSPTCPGDSERIALGRRAIGKAESISERCKQQQREEDRASLANAGHREEHLVS